MAFIPHSGRDCGGGRADEGETARVGDGGDKGRAGMRRESSGLEGERNVWEDQELVPGCTDSFLLCLLSLTPLLSQTSPIFHDNKMQENCIGEAELSEFA